MESLDYNQYFLKYRRIGFVWSIMIVYRHALNYSVYTLQRMSTVWLIEKIAYELTGCATVGFAILAGYNFFRNYTAVDGLRKVKSRIHTQVIPYVIAVSINWMFFASLPYIPYIQNKINGVTYPFTVKSYLDTILTGGGTPLWFLRNLILATVVSPALYYVIKNLHIGALCYSIGFVLYALFPKDQFSISYFFLGYFWGAMIAIHKPSLIAKKSNRVNAQSWLAILCLLIVTDMLWNYSENESIRLMYSILLAFSFWISSDLWSKEMPERKYYSDGFFIFIYHYIVLESMEKIVWVVFGNHEWAALFDFVVCPIVTICTLITMSTFVRSRFPKIHSLLCGGR